MASPAIILGAINFILGARNFLVNIDQDSNIADIKKNINQREMLLSKDIQNLINQQMGSDAMITMNSKLSELVDLKSDLVSLIEHNKEVEKANYVVESINEAMDPFIAFVLAQLSSHGLAITAALDANFKIADIVGSITKEQEDRWRDFVTTVSAVVENLEVKISDLERLISINQSFQAELSFQMLALKTETNARLVSLQDYIKVKENELAIQLRVLGSLQDNSTVVLTEMGELVYSNSVVHIGTTPVIAGPLNQENFSGLQGVRVTGFNVRQADLVGDGSSLSTNEDTFINLNVDYNGEVLYVALRTQGNVIFDALNLTTITTIRNVTHTVDNVTFTSIDGWTHVERVRNVTTGLRDPADVHNFHFGLVDSIGALPQLVNVETLKGSPGLSILKLSVDPGVKANFPSLMSKSKVYSVYGGNVAASQTVLDGGIYKRKSSTSAKADCQGAYRKTSTLLDFNSSLYKARVIIKIPKSHIGIDGITVFSL